MNPGFRYASSRLRLLYDQNIGYWQPDLQGMDYLSQEDFGSLLTRYLELSEQELASAIEKMLSSGDHELGARTTALTQYPSNKKLQELKKLAFLRLIEKYQEFNPFKFIIYSQSIHHETPQLQQRGDGVAPWAVARHWTRGLAQYAVRL